MKNMIKSFSTVVAIFFSLTPTYGQSDCLDSIKYKTVYMKRIHNVVGFVPSKARVTNGWAIGWSVSVDDYCVNMDSIRINGVHTNISPIQAFVGGTGVLMALFQPKELLHAFRADTSTIDDLAIRHKLNGVSISLLEFGEEFSFQGVQITGLVNKVDKVNGLSVSTLISDNVHFNGVTISALHNRTNNGRGAQIALINNATRLRGVQIGLWNRIGKRSLPLINMSFKKS